MCLGNKNPEAEGTDGVDLAAARRMLEDAIGDKEAQHRFSCENHLISPPLEKETAVTESVYDIAGRRIRICCDWEYNDSDAFAQFMAGDGGCPAGERAADLIIRYHLTDEKMIFPEPPVCETQYEKYYIADGCLWRAYNARPWLDVQTYICYKNAKARPLEFPCFVLKSELSRYRNSLNILYAAGIEDIMMELGVFILHSSFVCVGGRALLFSGPSGIGKSTQAILWEKHENARIINGDRSAIVHEDGKWYACGLPIAGSSRIFINERYEIAAIIFLEQADSNSMRRAGGAEGVRLIAGESFSREGYAGGRESTLMTAARLAGEVPVFKLCCLPDESAVECAKEFLGV